MARLVFVDVDDTLLTPPYDAVRKVSTFLGKKFPEREAFSNRAAVDYHKAFPELFNSAAEMWAIALLSLPFGHFRSQSAMPFDVAAVAKYLADPRLYLISKNPPSFTRWRVQRLRQIFNVDVGDRYIACGPILKKSTPKLMIMRQIAAERGVLLQDCLLIDDSVENIREAAAAGVRCALLRSSWNLGDIELMQTLFPELSVIDSREIPKTLAEHLGSAVQPDRPGIFVVPPLTVTNRLRLAWTLVKRWWLYGEPIPNATRIVAIAQTPVRSWFKRDPHAAVCRRISSIVTDEHEMSGLRILPLASRSRPILAPLDLSFQLSALDDDQKVRLFRTRCRDLLQSRGHSFVRDAMFYFTALDKDGERHRVLTSGRVAQAKTRHMQEHGVTQEAADKLALRYSEEVLTSRSYVSCLFGEWVLDTILAKILKTINLRTHPRVRELEGDHFLFYAATHRSYLDSAILWSILSHNGQSFPFAVGADKMRTVWLGRLGVRGGTFFIKRKFIDEIYGAIIAEHVASMQKPGSVIEVFLEGQRSRSGLTLPPKKGIASIVWENMAPHSKVAIVPVSFTYNKIPESEKLVYERFDERKKHGLLSLREVSDMRIKKARRKTTFEKFRASIRRLRSPLISECYVHFAEPIVLDKSADPARLQEHLNETMLSINAATAVLPSSILCLFVLGSDAQHTTLPCAVEFLNFAKAMVTLYQLPSHLTADLGAGTPEADVRAFNALPFVNRKFKRVAIKQDEIISIDAADFDRAIYYKNNVLHFFVLPAILSYVLTHEPKGRIEELHRCFDHMFAKLQKTYFLPRVSSTAVFIDAFIVMLSKRGVVEVSQNQWTISDAHKGDVILQTLARLGAEIVQGDLPHLLDAIRRSSDRKAVHVPSRLKAVATTPPQPAQAVDVSQTDFTLQFEGKVALGDRVDFTASAGSGRLSGVVANINAPSVAVQRDPTAGGSAEVEAWVPGGTVINGHVTFEHEHLGVGTITDLSSKGAFVATPLRLELGAILECWVGQSNNAFVLRGRVARVTQTGVGVRFEDLSEESRARIVLLSLGKSVAAV